MSQYRFSTSIDDIVGDFASIIKGQTILTTGVSPNGLGATFVEAVAKAEPRALILAARDPKKLEETAANVRTISPHSIVRTLALDLSSLAEVRKAASEVNSWPDIPVIDVLVNNAGIMATGYGPSVDGFDLQLATNHLGHFLFTNQIMPKLLASATPRVVAVSSAGCRSGGIRFADWNFDEGRTFNTWFAYGQSKTANILFARSLAKKLGAKGLSAFSLHPGVIKTGLLRHTDADSFGDLQKLDREQGWTEYWNGFDHLWKTPGQGAATHGRAAFDPSLTAYNGAYLDDCQPVADKDQWSFTRDDVGAEMLWELSEKLVGEKFTY